MFKFTCWVCGTDPVTLERERVRVHQSGQPKQSETITGPKKTLRSNVTLIRGGLVFKAHRLVYHSTLALGITKKKKKFWGKGAAVERIWHM